MPDGYNAAISDETRFYSLAVNASTQQGEKNNSIKLLLPDRIHTLDLPAPKIGWQTAYNLSLRKCYVDQYFQPDLEGGYCISKMTVINNQGQEAALNTQDAVMPKYAVLFAGFNNIANLDSIGGYFQVNQQAA